MIPRLNLRKRELADLRSTQVYPDGYRRACLRLSNDTHTVDHDGRVSANLDSPEVQRVINDRLRELAKFSDVIAPPKQGR